MEPNRTSFGVFFEGQYACTSERSGVAYDPQRDLALLKDAGVDTVSMQLYETYRGTLFYDSKRFPQFRQSTERDYLGETIEAAHKLGMKVWLWSAEKGVPIVGPIYDEFKDCIELDQHGHPLATWDHNFLCTCINSRWRQFLLQVYEEVLTSYEGIDCIIVSDEVGYNDAVRWGGYCPRCAQRFRAVYGQEPPTTADWENRNSLWWSFVRERFAWWTDYVAELAAGAKRVAPHVSTAVIINWFALGTVLKAVDPWQIAKIPDLDLIGSDLFFRVFEHDHPTYQSFVGSLMRALAAPSGKRVFLTSSAYRTVPPADIVIGTLDGAVHAEEGIFYYNLRHLCDRPLNLQAVHKVAELARIVQDRLPDAVNDAGCAIILPKYLWQEHYYENSTHLVSELLGMYQALTLAGVPTQIVLDDPLPDLSQYYLVVVPELYSVPASLAEALKGYVQSGGTLWMSLQGADGPCCTGEVDLWRTFSAGYAGRTPPLRFLRSNDPVLVGGNPVGATLSLPVYDWPVVQHQLFGGFPSVSHERALLDPSPASQTLLFGYDDEGRQYPVLIETALGAGMAILSAESFGASFNSYMQKCAGHPSMWMQRAMTMRNFLRRVVERHAGHAMPVKIETEGNVAAFCWRSRNGYAVGLVSHEYSQKCTVSLSLQAAKEQWITEAFSVLDCRETRRDGNVSIQVTVEPATMAVVVFKAR